jgi:predicted outer membrane repeat protein
MLFFSVFLATCGSISERKSYANNEVGLHWDVESSNRSAMEKYEMLMSQARNVEAVGNIKEAIQKYNECIELVTGLEYGYDFLLMGKREEFLADINAHLLPLYEKNGNFESVIEILTEILLELPTPDNYLSRAKIYETIGKTEMSESDINLANRLERVYYVSSRGNDIQNDGRSELSPFGSLSKAIEACKKGAIKTIVVIGALSNIEFDEGPWRKTFYSITNSDNEILIIGKYSGGLIASGENLQYFNPTVINISGNFRFANIGIHGGNTGMIINSGSNVILDTGVIVGGNTGGGSSWLTTPNGTGIVNNGNLIIQGNAKIINNSTASINSAGGITNNGTLLIKNDVIVSGNQAKQNRDNRGGGNGGGILNTGILMVQDNVKIFNNSAVIGAGIYNNGTLRILGGEISNNKSSTNGGGIYSSSILSMSNGLINENTAEYGGGVYVSGGTRSSFSLTNGNIIMNKAKFVGGGIYIEKNVQFTNSNGKVVDNQAGDGDGNNIFQQ